MSPLIFLLFLFGLTYSQVLAGLVSEAIVGGNYAKSGQFKYLVSVQFGTQHCGGAIIAEQYILTAAHCVTDGSNNIKIQPYEVVAGIHDLNDVKHAITIPAETVYIHKEYDPHTYHNDIAILKLKNGLDISHHRHIIEKINLPKSDYNLDNLNAVVAGYGLQHKKIEQNKAGYWEEVGSRNDEKLKYAHVKVLPHKLCVTVLAGQEVYDSTVCGQVNQHNKHHFEGVCDGDSGSPLVHGNDVIGVLSASPFACDESTKPGQYIRVGSYLNLINGVLSGKPGNDVKHVNVPH